MTEKPNIPQVTLETVAKSLYKETLSYGFRQVDYVRFVNCILDCAMQNQADRSCERQSSPLTIPKGSVKQMPVESDQIVIRPLCRKDLNLIARWLEDSEGRYFQLSRTTARNISLDELINSEKHVVGMITLPDKKPIGTVAFLNRDRLQKKAELRKLIGDPQYRGRGLAREAASLWIQFGIQGLKLHKIYLNTLDTNIRNIRLNEDLGFRVEGILRDEILVDGEYKDVLRMGLVHG
jgi:RimJ/RimL family protein N-acetyltransferase